MRGNYEEGNKSSAANRLDPMRIIHQWRDPFPKPNLDGGFIGDRYILCTDLPAHSFLKEGAHYRLLGGNSSPELMQDPDEFANDAANNILRAELSPDSALYQKLHNDGDYDVTVELESDFACFGIECQVDTLRVVKVGSVYYEFVQQPCVQLGFYSGKRIQLRDNYRVGAMCSNPNLAIAREACCLESRHKDVETALMETGVTYLYEGERMSFTTANERCSNYGKDLCLYESIRVIPSDDKWRKGYHWTNKDCGVNVKVNP